jgi:hypothetical protein
MEDGLCVGVSGEPMTAGFEFGAQFHVIEDLTVEDDPEPAVLVADGLLPAAQVDDAEPGIPKAYALPEIDAELVGPPMPDHAQHLAERGLLRRGSLREVQNTNDAAHISVD